MREDPPSRQSVVDGPGPDTVWQAGVEDWAVYRAVRLASLADTPEAFGSTLERENAMTEAQWRARFANAAIFLGGRGGDALTTATAIPCDDPRDGGIEIVGVWAHPSVRGTGLPAATLRAVIAWTGDRRVRLWVSESNPAAERFYLKLGFVPTGRRSPLPRDHSIMERQLALVR